jgi:capsular exopolysaccharide synthesis family protein
MRADNANMEPDEYPQLRDYLWLLWMRKGSLLAVIAVVVGLGIIESARQTRLYQSSAEVLVRPVNFDPSRPPSGVYLVDGIPGQPELRNLEPERRVATSEEVGQLVRAQLGRLQPAGITVEAPKDSNTLIFKAMSPSPVVAQRTARAYTDAYLAFRRQEALDDFRATSGPLGQRIEQLNGQIDDVQRRLSAAATDTEAVRTALQIRFNSLFAQRQSLESKLNDFLLPENLSVGRVLHGAALPVKPVSPNHPRAAALALVLGVALGAGQALVRSRFDPRLQGRGELAAGVGAPVLALIPGSRGQRSGLVTVSAPGSKDAEAYRVLGVAVLFAFHRQALRSLLITSPNAGEGATRTAANLAVSLAQAGKRVVLISVALQRSGLQSYLVGTGDFGLTSVLTGDGQECGVLTRTFVDGLRIHSGPTNGGPSEVLASDGMRKVLDEVERDADVVLIDAPAVLGAADTLAVAPIADAVLVVAAADRTTCAALHEARIQLEQVGANVIGAVLESVNGARAKFDKH